MKSLLAIVVYCLCFNSVSWAADAKTEATVVVRTSESWDGTQLPLYPEGQPEIAILTIKIPPGTTLAEHKHPVISAGYMISGELTVVKDSGETLHLKAGDSIGQAAD